jgi:hypothetical protein
MLDQFAMLNGAPIKTKGRFDDLDPPGAAQCQITRFN